MSRLVLAGFPKFGEDDACLVSASLTSSDNIDGGTLRGSGHEFSSSGVKFADGASAISWDLSAYASTLRNGGRITFWVDPLIFDAATASASVNQGILTLYTSTTLGSGTECCLLRQETSANTGRISSTNFANTNADSRTNLTASGKTAMIRVDCTWNYGTMYVYYHYLLGSRYTLKPIATFPANTFNTIVLGAPKGWNAAHEVCYSGAWFKDFEVSTRPIWLPVNHNLLQLLTFGDSFLSSQGDYPDNGSGTLFATNNGTVSNATNDVSVDGGYLPAIHRALHERGLYLGRGKIVNYAVGGSAVSQTDPTYQLETQVTNAINAHRQGFVGFISIGTNDVGRHIAGTATINAAWKSLYTDQIDRILALRCNHLVIANVCSRRAATASQTTAFDDATALANGYIEEIASEYSEVSMADMFTVMGGHSVDLGDFKSDDIHPLPPGATKLGNEAAKVIAARIGL